MAREHSVRYTLAFATAVSVACALMVALAAVMLQPRQAVNARQYMQMNVLLAAGLVAPDDELSPAQQRRLFEQRIETRLVDFGAGALIPADRIDAGAYDQRRARRDPAQSRTASPNRAGVTRLPHHGVVYLVKPAAASGPVQQAVLPIEGLGMWGTVYGFIALAPDANTVLGLAFYEQKETPGLGGEIGSPQWQALWRGRKAYDAQWQPELAVVKGTAGPPETDPHRVDGLSGATITSNAITRLVQFWLSDEGYGRWLRDFRQAGNA